MESVRKGERLIPTPRWFIGIRVAQIVVSLIVVALAGYFIHGAYADPLGVAIATGIFTWIVALYAILTEHSAACRSGYNTWAVLALDGFLIVLWLASLGANAAFRAAFTTPVNTECYNDGSAVNSNHCIVYKRGYVAGPTGLAALAGVAGLSAVPLLLFVVTFAYVTHHFRLEWAKESADVEKTAGAAPGAAPVGQPQAFPDQQQQQQQPQWAQQQQYQPNTYPSPGPAYDPYTQPQNPAYPNTQGAYNQTVPQQQQVAQELPSPHGTPAPGQPYYPTQ
jgi:hypothetical protein